MTAHTLVNEDIGVSWVQTDDGWEVVSVDGLPASRTIRKAPSGFIAFTGHQQQCWSFNHALMVCADHVRMHREMQAEAEARSQRNIASLIEMTPAAKARAIARLEAERDLLDYADSEMDTVTRKARIDRQIAGLRGV
jgi:hypothetical protein